ncbi:MAG: hypothetical protein HRU04_12190 [Oceanospirillaceae bacterium]|nr:hypothetical protein [Oceanospirillaceae bacterium]
MPSELKNKFSYRCKKAERAGLVYRNIKETVSDIYAWMINEIPYLAIDLAINREKEQQLLALWGKALMRIGFRVNLKKS